MKLSARLLIGVVVVLGCNPFGDRAEELGITKLTVSPEAIVMTNPGVYRAQVTLSTAAGSPYDASVQADIASTGPVSASWIDEPRRPYVLVRPTGTGDATVTVGIGSKKDVLQVQGVAVSAKAVDFSSGNACLIATDESAWCWGGNRVGQLGAVTLAQCNGAFCQYGGQDGNETPLRVGGSFRFQRIATGGFVCASGSAPVQACGRNCAIDASNQVYCFGFGGAAAVPGFKLKSLVIRPASFSYTSDEEVCGIALDDTARCFRFIGNMNSQSTDIGSGMTFSVLGVGRYHACGIDMAGDAWCWGDNRFGQLGNGQIETARRTTPVRVASSLKFTQIDLGDQSTCALDTAGTIHCWGRGAGTDGGILPSSCPDLAKCVTTPTPLIGQRAYTSFSQNTVALVCGLTAAGAVDCWKGFEAAPIVAKVPVPLSSVSVGRSLGVTSDLSLPYVTGIGSSFSYYACGIGTDATVYCWNDGASYKIGR